MTPARFALGAIIVVLTLAGAVRRRAVAHPSPPMLVPVAGSGIAGAGDGAVATARFSSPRGIAFDRIADTIVVADTANHAIRRIANGQVTTIARGLRLPHGIAVDAQGRVWICDTGNHAIRRIEQDGTLTVIAGAIGTPGESDGSPLAARFRFPEAIVVESDTSVIVADTGNHKLRRITADRVTTIATASPLRSPSGVALDAASNLYVAEREANAVRKIAANGIESIVVADLLAPNGIAIVGNALYAADSCRHAIRRIPGDAIAGGLAFPYAVAAGDGDGELLIADTRHHVIRALRGVR